MTDQILTPPEKSTKIVATIGPATETEESIEKLILAGMNVARFNTKHGTPEWHKERLARVRRVAERLGKPVATLLDLQGPEIRLDLPEGVEFFDVNEGDTVTFTSDRAITEPNTILVPQEVIDAEDEGNRILIDDGAGEFFVVAKNAHSIVTEVHDSFAVKKRKTVNTPGVTINMPSLIDADYVQLDNLSDELVDFIALSFVRNVEDIRILREEMAKRNLHAAVMAKIENQSAIDNLEAIIKVSDAVMVARGDLGVEVPFEELTRWQKEIILLSRIHAKPVITATQMLKSMVDSPVPTRAEVSDISNAVYDGTDAVMLSEETTIGKYPVKAVKTQAKIAAYAEQHATPIELEVFDFDVSTAITHAAVLLLESAQDPDHSMKIDAVICLSATGTTARSIARFRKVRQLHVFTNRPSTYRKLALVYGVQPHLVNFSEQSLDNSSEVMNTIKDLNVVSPGEVALIVHGTAWNEPGLTNSLRILRVE
ncbi:pyruvate kinase [Candidatus Woesebacteria bacterium]|nr:pyruvate kinase [Candidatus Woesebacteria bacterium]